MTHRDDIACASTDEVASRLSGLPLNTANHVSTVQCNSGPTNHYAPVTVTADDRDLNRLVACKRAQNAAKRAQLLQRVLAMKSDGISQKVIAIECGVSEGTISNLVGKRTTGPLLVTVDGVTLGVSHWAAVLGMTTDGIYRRMRAGWSPEKACSVPPAAVNQRRFPR